jgi:hypothetical protein
VSIRGTAADAQAESARPAGHLFPMTAYAHPFVVAPMMDSTDGHCRFSIAC